METLRCVAWGGREQVSWGLWWRGAVTELCLVSVCARGCLCMWRCVWSPGCRCLAGRWTCGELWCRFGELLGQAMADGQELGPGGAAPSDDGAASALKRGVRGIRWFRLSFPRLCGFANLAVWLVGWCLGLLLCVQGTYAAKRAKKMAKTAAAAWRAAHPELVSQHESLRAGAGVVESRRGQRVLSQHRGGRGVRGGSLSDRASRRPKLPTVDETAFGRVRLSVLFVCLR